MKETICHYCNYTTTDKPNYNKHMKSKKHIETIESLKSKKTKLDETKWNEPYSCKYCEKHFVHKQSMQRHIKYYCTKSDDEDLQELVRLLNIQNKEIISQNKNQQKQIDQLTNKLQIQNNNIINNGTVNNTTNNTINYNVNLLNYDNTDYDRVTDEDYIRCIMNCNSCVKSFIKHIHFNDDFPENKNIFISNIKSKYIMLYNEDKWQLVTRKTQLEYLYEDNEMRLEDWIAQYKVEYPHAARKYAKYLRNKTNEDILNRSKEEIIMLLYNERNTEGNKRRSVV